MIKISNFIHSTSSGQEFQILNTLKRLFIGNWKLEIGNSRALREQGFTFIELILYISIVTIMLTAIIPFAWNIIGSGSKSSTEQEVYSQARYVSERLKYEIRGAAGINQGASNFDVNLANNSSQKLQLAEQSPVNTLDISVTTAGEVQLDPGNDVPYTINSLDSKVTDLTFINYTSTDNKTKHVGFTLTITSNYSESRKEFKETITLRSSAEVRNN